MEPDNDQTAEPLGERASHPLAAAYQAWIQWFGPLAAAIDSTDPGSAERADILAQWQPVPATALTAMPERPGNSPLASALRALVPLLGPWSGPAAAAMELESALMEAHDAVRRAEGELRLIAGEVDSPWRARVLELPRGGITAETLAEVASELLEQAWDRRLRASEHADALVAVQHAHARVRRALAAFADAVSVVAGLPTAAAMDELEATIDRMDRERERELEALREEVAGLRDQVRRLQRGGPPE
ncbi:hypothetical protein QWY84_05705 [Aquisalimonas lutea]|uniref:hypothetical protein n=1 Tax=Aquisalimonas lutea TaxID=1327750 RepID=UPI0025B57351|nr:hypothetical protein [Aquisalimonas lutea]MDN3517099.1 hypothetical protein [Aquisalimonas lutea]